MKHLLLFVLFTQVVVAWRICALNYLLSGHGTIKAEYVDIHCDPKKDNTPCLNVVALQGNSMDNAICIGFDLYSKIAFMDQEIQKLKEEVEALKTKNEVGHINGTVQLLPKWCDHGGCKVTNGTGFNIYDNNN